MELDSTRPSVMARKAVAEMIALQRRIFKRQRRMIEAFEVHQTAGFVKYRNEYRRAVEMYLHEVGFGAMCDAIAAARVAYVADYHTLRLAQKTLHTVLRAVMHQVDNLSLAVEFVDHRYQEDLDRYLEGRIAEATFLRRIRYKEQWPYDIWPNFKPLFELAREQGFPVTAIDSDARLPLAKRDAIAARLVAELAARHPASTIVVSAGQMHMAPSHLPAKVDLAFIRAGMAAPERVIVFQNAEEIYWQLAREGREEAEVVLVAPGQYCVNNTPPLVQQLSYLHWVQFDEDLIEYTQAEQTVRSLVSDLARYLRLDVADAADRVRVMVPGDLDLMDVLDDAGLDDEAKRRIVGQAEAQESVCVPSLELIYLATLSVNHAAEEAAHYLRHVASGGLEPKGAADGFYFLVLNEACAFFGSKVINPKRKADHPGRLRAMLGKARTRGRLRAEDRAARFALAHLAWERGGFQGRRPLDGAQALSDYRVFGAAAHFLGYVMGDKLYYGLTDGLVPKSTIRDLFLAPLDAEGAATDTYLELSRRLSNVVIPRRI